MCSLSVVSANEIILKQLKHIRIAKMIEMLFFMFFPPIKKVCANPKLAHTEKHKPRFATTQNLFDNTKKHEKRSLCFYQEVKTLHCSCYRKIFGFVW